MKNEDTFIFFKVLGVVAVVIFLLLVMADCTVVRRRDIVELELLTVRSGTIMDSTGFPQYAYRVEYSGGQLCVSDQVRVLRTKGGIFGWFPYWYLIERAGG